jgi:hypothetical protein
VNLKSIEPAKALAMAGFRLEEPPNPLVRGLKRDMKEFYAISRRGLSAIWKKA